MSPDFNPLVVHKKGTISVRLPNKQSADYRLQ